MSLSPQRPNYVLIWIGVVMLTFSLAGKWLMLEPKGATVRFSTSDVAEAGGPFFDEVTGAMDSRIYPDGTRVADLTALPPSPAVLSEDEAPPIDWDFAGAETLLVDEHGLPLTPEELERLEREAQAEVAEIGSSSLVDPHGTQPDAQSVHHAFNHVESEGPSKRSKAKNRLRDSGKLEAFWAGGRGLGAKGFRRRPSPPDGVGVRTTITPMAKDRLLVRFHLHGLQGPQQDLADRLAEERQDLDPQMLRRASELLSALDSVVDPEQAEDEDQADADRRERLRLERMQGRLVQHLKQRPGGVELVAELSPDQLRSLLHKIQRTKP